MLKNKNKGITLVALVITIIILLILAGISISALTNTGIFGKAKEAKKKSEDATLEQNKILDNYEKEVDQYLPAFTGNTVEEAIQHGRVLNATDNTELHDEKGNKIVVPAGFKVTGDATTIDKGIVIEDATTGATSGSQFVWIPVGTITKADGTTVGINLNRYAFDSNGIATEKNEEVIDSYYSETESKGNTVAKSISNFKSSVATNGGYYIGRYEARTTTARNDEGNALTQITEKETDQVYNYVTQLQAASQAQNMYNDSNFTSDLMNSYAWDTATLFLQNCGTNKKYSRQTRLNSSLLQTGTNTLTETNKIDKQCNVYDMASNIFEWTTETSSNSGFPCVGRGGIYDNSTYYTSVHNYGDTSYSTYSVGFRPLLYL